MIVKNVRLIAIQWITEKMQDINEGWTYPVSSFCNGIVIVIYGTQMQCHFCEQFKNLLIKECDIHFAHAYSSQTKWDEYL